MAITFNSVKCPECGANLPVEKGRERLFCSYCGTQVIITNENEHIYRYIDEAGMVQADNSKEIRMRELSIEEQRGYFNDNLRKTLIIIWLIVSILLLVIGIGIMFMTGEEGPFLGFGFLVYVGGPVIGGGAYVVFKLIPEKENEKYLARSGGIKFPKSLEPFSGKNYEVIYSTLINLGFTNIVCINMHDLTVDLLEKKGEVEKVIVDGKNITLGGRVYMPNTPISILYHGR